MLPHGRADLVTAGRGSVRYASRRWRMEWIRTIGAGLVDPVDDAVGARSAEDERGGGRVDLRAPTSTGTPPVRVVQETAVSGHVPVPPAPAVRGDASGGPPPTHWPCSPPPAASPASALGPVQADRVTSAIQLARERVIPHPVVVVPLRVTLLTRQEQRSSPTGPASKISPAARVFMGSLGKSWRTNCPPAMSDFPSNS